MAVKPMIGSAAALMLTAALAGGAWAQGTTNQVPSDCAKLTTPQAKDECARAYKQKNTPGTNQGGVQGTGVGKGQGQGVGQGSGQGATQGVGTGNKKK